MADTQVQLGYNPEYNPTGIEGGLGTNALPWLPLRHADALFIKPLRAGLNGFAGLKPLSRVMVTGTVAQPATSGALVINATGVYVAR